MFWPITFANKGLSNDDWWYRNIEVEALGILHGLEKFQSYCFAHEVHVISDHKPLVAIIGKDM